MLTTKDIADIHEILVDWFVSSEDPISPAGVRDEALLASAVARPLHTVDGEDAYDTIFSKAAALFHSLVNNHAFHNGNKRIALVATQAYLAQEGRWLDHSSDEEMYDFTTRSASHELTTNRQDEHRYITEWLDSNSRKIIKGEHPLKYGELKHILQRFGYSIDLPDGEMLYIYKNGQAVERIIKQGISGFRPYHTDYISGLRKRLNLTAEYGVDSAKFYGQKGVGNDASLFIEIRIEVMRRLAKT